MFYVGQTENLSGGHYGVMVMTGFVGNERATRYREVVLTPTNRQSPVGNFHALVYEKVDSSIPSLSLRVLFTSLSKHVQVKN